MPRELCDLEIARIVSFVPHDTYLMVATISRAWRNAWKHLHRPAITSLLSCTASPQLLSLAFAANVPVAALAWLVVMGRGSISIGTLLDIYERMPVTGIYCDLPHQIAAAAADADSVETLRDLHDRGYAIHRDVMQNIILRANPESVEWLIEEFPESLDEEMVEAAVSDGLLDVVEMLLRGGCHVRSIIGGIAVRWQDRDLLYMLLEYDCPWNSDLCGLGDEEDQRWIHENHCPWDGWYCEFRDGRHEFL